MEFEKKLKSKIDKKIREQIEKNFKTCWDNFDKLGEDYLENVIYEILRQIRDFINFYNEKISDKSKKIHYDDEDVTLEDLMNLKRKIELNKSEKEYIEYEYEADYLKGDNIKAIIEVLIRRMLSEKIKMADLTGVDKLIEEEFKENIYVNKYLHIISLVSGKLFEESEDKFSKMVSYRVEENFNFYINCGGYALEVDTCIFPAENDGNNFERSVSSILELFPFVRLLGDTKLQEDEYLVLFRASKNGHHFIKQVDDGTFVEKEGGHAPKKFVKWSESFENSQEAEFAVKKDHDIEYFDKYGSIIIPIETAKNFEETVIHTIQNMQNTFEYHNHTFQLKKSDEGIIYVCSMGKIVAQVLIDDKDYDIEIKKEYKEYISNAKPTEIMIENNTQRTEKNDIEGGLHDR